MSDRRRLFYPGKYKKNRIVGWENPVRFIIFILIADLNCRKIFQRKIVIELVLPWPIDARYRYLIIAKQVHKECL